MEFQQEPLFFTDTINLISSKLHPEKLSKQNSIVSKTHLKN